MDIAQQIVTQVAQGDFAAVERRLADRIKPFLPVGTIRATWQGLEQQFGAFQEQGKTSAVQTQDGLVQVVTCVFERASLDVNIVLNDAGEIVGLRLRLWEPSNSRRTRPMSLRRTRSPSVFTNRRCR